MRHFPKCLDCNKELKDYRNIRCLKCLLVFRRQKSIKINKGCLMCNVIFEVWPCLKNKKKFCSKKCKNRWQSINNRGDKHWHWMGGWKNKLPNCEICGVRLVSQYSKTYRCSKHPKPMSEETKKKISLSNLGKFTSIKVRRFCSERLKKLWQTFKYREEMKKLMNSMEYKEKVMEGIRNGVRIRPNKPEKILDDLLKKILPLEYKYVGDFSFFVGGYNPDFINIKNQKKIIELFGDYWHNLNRHKKRDKYRLMVYDQCGYDTLVIWQHELVDLDMVINKILNFNRSCN